MQTSTVHSKTKCRKHTPIWPRLVGVPGMHWQWGLTINCSPSTYSALGPCLCLSFQEVLEMNPLWPESDHFVLKGLHQLMLCGFFLSTGSLPRHPTEWAAEDANPAAHLWWWAPRHRNELWLRCQSQVSVAWTATGEMISPDTQLPRGNSEIALYSPAEPLLRACCSLLSWGGWGCCIYQFPNCSLKSQCLLGI